MKPRLYLVTLILLCVSSTVVPQIQHTGAPLSNSFTLDANVHTVKMSPVNVKALLLEDEQEELLKDIPYRFGYPFHTDYGINNSGTRDTLADGRKIWRLKIQSDSAFSINLIFDRFFIPPGGSMFVYNKNKSMVLGAFTEKNNLPERVFSTTPVKGDCIIIEYDQPSSVAALPEIHISVVVHAYKNLFAKIDESISGFGSSGSCNINVNCPAGDEWINQARTVAMILLADNSRICTGSLINNIRNDGTPYFLTANHCWDSSQPTWIFMFRYESPDCSNIDGPTTYTISGSTLLSRNPDSDFLLLRLSSTPPNSYNPYYAGWNRQDIAATSGAGIHHPRGDIKKISFSNSSFTNYTSPGTPTNSHWQVNWSAGVTEPGSSGSPIFDQNMRVVGQLHGGPSYCGGNQLWDYYGKFSMSWNYGSSSSTRLRDWLDPDNTGAQVLDGLDGGLLSLASENKSINQTATSYNNGRRLVQDGAGYWHLVFSSGGQIFYRKRTPWGEWQTPIQISNGNFNDFPCITITNNSDLFAVWQRKSGTNTYEIFFAMSQDWGFTWTLEHRYILTTITSSLDPLPVIHAYYPGYYKIIAFGSNSGLISYTTSTQYPYNINWTQQVITSDANYSRPALANGDGGPSITLLAYQHNAGGVYYRYHNSSVWSSETNLSLIVPGSGVHQTPSITNIPGNPQIHVAWKKLIGSGSSIYDHLIVHRRATNYYTWPNEWFGTYYNSQEYPSITGLATNKVDLLFQTPPQFGNPYVYRMRFNGSYWGSPIYIANNSRYPSVSSGSTTAQYVWTSGSTSPYTVNMGSGLSKEAEVDPRDFYSRSIAWLDSTGSFLEVKLHPIYVKMKDGTKQRVDILPASLDTFNLTLENSFSLLSSLPFSLLPGAEEIIIDFSISSENAGKVVKNDLNNLRVAFTLEDSKSQIVRSLNQNQGIGSDKFSVEKQKFSIPLNGVLPSHVVKVAINLEALIPKEGVFASIGHIYDYTSLSSDEKETQPITHSSLPLDVTLGQNYPNPFNPVTTIAYRVKTPGKVSLKVFDVLGKEVATLVNREENEGVHTQRFDASHLTSGIYFYQLIAPGVNETRKMLIAK